MPVTAEEFRAARIALGLTQRTAAAALGVHEVTLRAWEGRRHRIPTMAALALEALRLQSLSGGDAMTTTTRPQLVEAIGNMIAQNIYSIPGMTPEDEERTIQRCNDDGWEPRFAAGLDHVSLTRYYLTDDELTEAKAIAHRIITAPS